MRAFVDRIESGIATLLLGEGEKRRITMPISILPPETREGDVLEISISVDRSATREDKSATQKLFDSLDNK